MSQEIIAKPFNYGAYRETRKHSPSMTEEECKEELRLIQDIVDNRRTSNAGDLADLSLRKYELYHRMGDLENPERIKEQERYERWIEESITGLLGEEKD